MAPTRPLNGGEEKDGVRAPRGGAANAAIFSVATGLGRVAGLLREIVAAGYFGVSGPMSAFTIAFHIPNFMRSLFADATLQGAFVPVFSDLLQQGRRAEAFRVATSLAVMISISLGALTGVFFLAAPTVIGVLAPGFEQGGQLADLTVALSRLMFPVVLLLALSGLVAGVLNSFDHFGMPALIPFFWNTVIVAVVVALVPLLPDENQIFAYGIGVLIGSIVQLALLAPWLRRTGARFDLSMPLLDANVLRVLRLMVPTMLTLGVVNLAVILNSFFGTLVSEEVPAAIDKAFRVYVLPQGLFSVAIATVLFPTLSRLAARGAVDDLRRSVANGLRQILLLLIPSAVLMGVLAVPITRLLYERGQFDAEATELTAAAMVWWAVALPAGGVASLLFRVFFSLQRPWPSTLLALANIGLNALVAFVLYRPLGIAGIVIGTVVGTTAMVLAQALYLRRPLAGIEAGATLSALARMLLAGAALGVVARTAWRAADATLGRGVVPEGVSLGAAMLTGLVVYFASLKALRVSEASQIAALVRRRRRGAGEPE